MKKNSIIWVTGLALLFVGCASHRVAVSYSPEEVSAALEQQDYQFLVRFVQPASGRMRQVTGVVHSLTVTKDKVTGDLPYFGRAYSAPMGTDGGIKFESSDFDYDLKMGSKGRREITIRVNNSQVVRELFLT